MSHRNRQGFTIIEILVVIAIIAIFSGIVGVYLVRSFHTTQLREAASQVAADIRRARSQAQRGSSQIVLNLPPASPGSQTYRVDTVAKTIPNNITMYCKDGCNSASLAGNNITNVTYLPPYGELDATGSVYILHSPDAGVTDLEIRLVGVTGKVIVAKAGS